MENELEVDGKVINFDVFNALNLHNPMLGDAYVNFNWNPLGDGFKLDLPFLEKFIENQRYQSETKKPSFMENEPDKVIEFFKNAAKNNKQMLKDLEGRLNSGEFGDYKNVNIEEQVKDMVFFLKCRDKMLEISMKQLKSNSIDALKAYENINALNRKLSELLEDAYYKEKNKKALIEKMILQAQLNQQKTYGNFEYVLKMVTPVRQRSEPIVENQNQSFFEKAFGVMLKMAGMAGLAQENDNNRTKEEKAFQQFEEQMKNPTADNLAEALSYQSSKFEDFTK